MNKKTNIFGKECIKIFNIGDCVSYTTLNGEKIFGIISKIYIENIEDNKDRKYAFAEIKNMYNEKVSILLSLISLESKVQ